MLARITRLGLRNQLRTNLRSNSRLILRYQSTVQGETKVKTPVTVDREFPDPFKQQKQNRYYFVAYGIGVTLSCIIIFNYEKTRSPVINSVLYCLRRSDKIKNELGNNIDFTSSWPWISGELNTMQGRIDIEFRVGGDRNKGTLKLKATRDSKLEPFNVHEWKLIIDDGPEIDLKKDTSVEFGF